MTTNINGEPDSELVFEKMNDIVGTPEILAVRRDLMEAVDILNTRFTLDEGVTVTLNISGSYRDGFRFLQSNLKFDYMITIENLRVFWNLSQRQHYDNDSSVDYIFAFDGSNSPPGYGLLQVMSPDADNDLHCVINGRVYVSSSKWKNSSPSFNSYYKKHGSAEAINMPKLVIDNVECVRSDFWPPWASSFEKRCHSWPEPSVLHDIVKNGCHLVPIGHKLGIHEKEEWRISFAMAENRLVYSMNHSQFLLYGLMKLFMKEVINRGVEENDELLCSYHIKIAVFWVLQQNSLPECNSRSFMQCFWICFKLIIKWVYEGNCPNFFIPENNLFSVKIRGSAQNKLFCELYALYENGPSCLFECPSIRDHLERNRAHDTNPNKINPLIRELFQGLDSIAVASFNVQSCVSALLNVEKLVNPNWIYPLVKRKATAIIYHQMAFCLLSVKFENNKSFYNADKLSRRVMRLAVKYGDVSDLLFSAMYCLRKRNLDEARAIVEKAKVILKSPDIVYLGHLFNESCVETKPSLKKSVSDVAKINYGFPVIIFNETFYIDELVNEQQHSLRTPWGVLIIPSLFFLHMLEFLCFRHVYPERAKAVLKDFSELLENNQDRYMIPLGRDISWHILGKCYEMSDNLQMALHAYRQSLKEFSINRIRTATEERIRIVESQMHN